MKNLFGYFNCKKLKEKLILNIDKKIRNKCLHNGDWANKILHYILGGLELFGPSISWIMKGNKDCSNYNSKTFL